MKKAVIAAVSVFIAIMVICSAFNESISALLANAMFNENVSVFSPSDKIQAAELKKNDYIYFGKFNGENILWKVISFDENGNPLLLSERAICFMPFNAGKAVTANTSDWKSSTIRQWLNSSETKTFEFACNPANRVKNDSVTVNGGFLCAENFTPEELSCLSDGEDRVFLPTASMLSAIPPNQMQKSPTAAAVINEASSYLHIRKNCWYWTQNPISTSSSCVKTVTASGKYAKCLANDALTGVCPALYLDCTEITVCGGNGTVKTPYIFASEGIINE